METTDPLIQLKNDIADLKKFIFAAYPTPAVSAKWIPRAEVMEFLNYRSTQMTAFENNDEIIVAKIGKRKFIHQDSFVKFSDKKSNKS